jgi:hypothetical protein
MSDLVREIAFGPAFDKRDPISSKDYGIHGVDMTWYIKGPEGAVQWKVFTNWHMPNVRQEWEQRERQGNPPPLCCVIPMAADLGYHSPKPMYENQTPMSNTCDVLGGVCYYDGSSLNAEPIFDLLVTQGQEACWQAIENYYRMTFRQETGI